MKLVLFIAVALLSLAAAAPTPQPVIGIIAEYNDDFSKTYIASSYVKFAEMSGVRVVPILADTPTNELDSTFDKINGLILPGGSSPLVNGTHGEHFSNYTKTLGYLIDKARTANDNGDFFPIWAVCNGFELFTLWIA